jgi:hypothetical protein
VERHIGGNRVRFDFDLDLGAYFELNFLPLSVGQIIGNTNLSIEMICPFDRDLSFFWFAGSGMRVNHPLNFSGERGTRFFGWHKLNPSIGLDTVPMRFLPPERKRRWRVIFSEYFYLRYIGERP